MGDLTKEMPKPMLEVKGRPILTHIIEGLRAAGVREFAIVTGFQAEVIEEYFKDGAALGVSIQYARQVTQDGTGKAPEYAKEIVGDSPFVLTYGDILVNPNTYANILQAYGAGKTNGVVTAKPGAEVKKGGILVTDATETLVKVVEKPSDEDIERLEANGEIPKGGPYLYNAGVYLFEPELFSFTAKLEKSPRGEYELTDAITALVDAGRSLRVCQILDDWVDVRDPGVLESIQ